MITRFLSLYFSWISLRCGMLLRQGGHQVAQNSRRTGLPAVSGCAEIHSSSLTSGGFSPTAGPAARRPPVNRESIVKTNPILKERRMGDPFFWVEVEPSILAEPPADCQFLRNQPRKVIFPDSFPAVIAQDPFEMGHARGAAELADDPASG